MSNETTSEIQQLEYREPIDVVTFSNGKKAFFRGDRQIGIVNEVDMSRINTAAENLQNSLDRINRDYEWVGDDDSNKSSLSYADYCDLIYKSRYASLFSPFIIRCVQFIVDYIFSRVPELGTITEDEDKQAYFNSVFNYRTNDYWGYSHLVKNGRGMLTDGGTAVRLYKHQNGILTRKQDLIEINTDETICNDEDEAQVWLWRREYKPKSAKKARVAYYPDIHFYPDAKLRATLEKRIAKIGREARDEREYSVKWETKIGVRHWNEGVPVASPAVPYADCMERLLELELAVRSAIATTAQNYQTQIPQEILQAKQGFENMAQDDEWKSNVVIGTGKLSSVNLNIAMLNDNSALTRLIHEFVYNVFPSLRPQSWAEDEVGGLSQNRDRNEQIEITARRIQNEWKGWYEELLEAIYVFASVGEESVSSPISTITIEPTVISADNQGSYTFYDVDYGEDTVSVSFPEISSEDTLAFVDSLVDVMTGKGVDYKLGKPSDLIRGFKDKTGFQITPPDENRDSWCISCDDNTDSDPVVERYIQARQARKELKKMKEQVDNVVMVSGLAVEGD